MSRKITFFAGVLSCFIVSNFFAAEKSNQMELATIKKAEFIPLEQGLKTLIPVIAVTLKTEGWGDKLIDKIMPSEKQLTLKALMMNNRYFKGFSTPQLFLPTIIIVNKDTSIIRQGCFDSMPGWPYTVEACRLKKAIFYAYKQGAIIDISEVEEFDLGLLSQNEITLKEMIDKTAQEKLNLKLPVFEYVR